jgi:hypothetical protein
MLCTFLLFPFIFIAPLGAQDIRTLKLSKIIDAKYDCINQGCSPLTIAHVSSLRACQITCLSDTQCRTVNFYQSNNQCELFADTPDQYGSFLAQMDVVAMTAIDDRKLSARK